MKTSLGSCTFGNLATPAVSAAAKDVRDAAERATSGVSHSHSSVTEARRMWNGRRDFARRAGTSRCLGQCQPPLLDRDEIVTGVSR